MLAQNPPVFSEFVDFLASAPSQEEILAYKTSRSQRKRLRYLLKKNRVGILTHEEKLELHEFLRLSHFMKMLKGSVRQQLRKNRMGQY